MRRQHRVASAYASSKTILQVVYRDPEHVSERLALHAVQQLGEPSLAWARKARETRPDVPRGALAAELRVQSAHVARVDGAISGTPFFVALVPGYVSYLWQEGRMALRTAALYDRDPRSTETAAEMLVLRGVHPDLPAAREALADVSATPERPEARRTPATWVRSIRQVLVFGGFLGPSDSAEERARGWRARLRTAGEIAIGGAIWVTTWILPLTFMVAMAWGCESHTRQLGRRVLAYYGGEAENAQAAIALTAQRHDRGHDRRTFVRWLALTVSIVVPFAFVVYADHVRQSTGVSWVGALGSLVALSLVIALGVLSRR